MPGNKGLLTVWTDVEAAMQPDFHEWYDREHLRERAQMPGFRDARRYRAAGSPEFVAVYDTESPEALSSPVYQKALSNQTAWSLKVFPSFRNTVRVVSEVLGEAGAGYGGWLVGLRCMPLPGRGDEARKALTGGLAATLHKTPGVVRVVTALGKVSGLAVFGTGACDPADSTRAVILVEGSDAAALAALAAAALSDVALNAISLGPPETRAVYALQYAVPR